MNQALLDKIVAAVLYEGYVLYPYRPSVKNQKRWTFGGVYPRSYSEAQSGSDPYSVQTECLVRGGAKTVLHVKARFLHLLNRQVGELDRPVDELEGATTPAYRLVEELEVDGRLLLPWQEAIERDCEIGAVRLAALERMPGHAEFSFDGGRQLEPVRDRHGKVVAVLVREQDPVAGAIDVSCTPAGDGLCKVRVRIENRTPLDESARFSRECALLRSLVSTHTILWVEEGEFVSLIDPPAEWSVLAASCQNQGTWPVLVGQPGEKDTILSSPIILYDYPQIAAESPGDLFDSTEIDEILTLRVLTLTEREKQVAAALDDHVRALLERTSALGHDQLRALHGSVRGLRPVPEGGLS